jgi:signal transduction histidine kinase
LLIYQFFATIKSSAACMARIERLRCAEVKGTRVNDQNEKIELIRIWLAQMQHSAAADSPTLRLAQSTLNTMHSLIQPERGLAPITDLSITYADLEQQVQEQTAALNRATTALKSQINERETAALKLREAYNNLEAHLQEHIVYQSKLNQRLQEQIDVQKQMQMREQEERVLTDALRDTLATMSNTLDLEKILDHILDTVKRVTPYDGANILLVESDLIRVAHQKGYDQKGIDKDWLARQIPLAKLAILQQLMDIGKPLAIPNTTTSSLWIGFPNLAWIHSSVIAPIRSNGKILGFISLDSATPDYFTQAQAERLQSFADQAAIAIQNARLLDRAKHTAVMAERNRIANEMHDTISQTLWSISLISERLPEVWEINVAEGRRVLGTLHQLTQSALAEMRSLLLELHPSSLVDAKMGVLIRNMADITTNRTNLSITVHIHDDDLLPPEVHFALYRVVQEALNNIVLHALASHVVIDFTNQAGRVELTIQDNGIGFDPTNIAVGHLGLRIMSDRMVNIGATLQTLSQRGNGTQIKVSWVMPTDPA